MYLRDDEMGKLYNEKVELQILELKKLPKEMQAGEDIVKWMRFFNPKEGLIPRSLLRNKLMTNEVSLGLIPRSLLRGVSLGRAERSLRKWHRRTNIWEKHMKH